MYWVLADQRTAKPGISETLLSASSTYSTATSFVRDPGTRLTGRYIDTDILRAVKVD